MASTGYSKYQKAICLAGDIFLLVVSFLIAYYIRFNQPFVFQRYDFISLFIIYVFSWWAISSSGYFAIGQRGVYFDKVLIRFFRNQIIHIIVVFGVIVLLRFYNVSRLMILYAFGMQVILLLSWRIVLSRIINYYRRKGYNFRNIMIIGTNPNAIDLYKTLTSNRNFGYRFLGFIAGENERQTVGECNVLDLSDFEKYAINNNLDEVYCTLTVGYEERIQEIIRYCENNLIRFKLVPNFQRYIKKQVTVSFIDHIPLILLRPEPLESDFSRLTKRVFDIVFSMLVIILLLSWLIPIFGILIRLESKGPVFFTQKRTGKDNKEFDIIKFRSMTVNTDADAIQATKGDARITKIGRFIRKSNIDELPQFLNVLAGHMSIVGPRPHMVKHTEEYSEIINKYMVRHFVKPGITGWAQVNGYRGETNTPELMRKRVEYDVWYIENWSFALDLFIILKTVLNIFQGEENAF